MGKELVRSVASAGRSPGVRAAPWGGSREARGQPAAGHISESWTTNGPSDLWAILTASATHSCQKQENPRPAQYCTTCSPFLGPNMAEPVAIKTYQI